MHYTVYVYSRDGAWIEWYSTRDQEDARKVWQSCIERNRTARVSETRDITSGRNWLG